MATPYVAKPGDTLAKIAHARLGSARKAALLADYNGLRSRRLPAGSRVLIPAAADLAQRAFARPRAAAWPTPPVGLQGVLAAFGNLYDFMRDDGTVDPKWELQQIARVELPFPIPLDWDTTQAATKVRCHKLLVPLLAEVFGRIVADGLRETVHTYGGCYQFRAKRNGSKPSTHSWGIAIDLNVRSNAMGTAGDMDPRLVQLMEGMGFVWGGRWSGTGKDPMHFQYCSAY